MKRIALLLSIIIAILACSCSQQVSQPSPYAHAKASTETKALHSTDLSSFARWEFKAEPQFEDSDVYGAVRSWRSISIVENSADLGYYTPGKWIFSVRGFNEQDQIIGEGDSGEVFLSTDRDNAVAIAVHSVIGEGEGDVYVDVSMQTLPNVTFNVSYSAVTFEDGEAVIGEPVDASPRFYRSTSAGTSTWQGYVRDLPSGTYVFHISVSDSESAIAGEAVEVKVLPGVRTDIEGNLTPGSFVTSSMSITTYGNIRGRITSADYDEDAGCTVIPENEVRTTLSWEVQSGVEPASYRWFVDGKRQAGETSSTFVFQPSNGAGEYTVSCIAMGRMSGESTSASMLVRFLP